jgi:hypothetical protein
MLVKKMKSEKAYWLKWYIGVLLFLIVQVILFFLITKYFS